VGAVALPRLASDVLHARGHVGHGRVGGFAGELTWARSPREESHLFWVLLQEPFCPQIALNRFKSNWNYTQIRWTRAADLSKFWCKMRNFYPGAWQLAQAITLGLLLGGTAGAAPSTSDSNSATNEPTQRPPAPRRPNIIWIVADDLGYGDLGCYGQTLIQTTNLDKLAAEGVRFTDFYAGSTVCAPSRFALMTGLHTGHAFIRGNGTQALRTQDLTVAELLQKAGYHTGLVGKWGLGNEN